MTSTTSSSTTEEDMEKLRASLREEVLGTKRLNDYFELRLLPTTQATFSETSTFHTINVCIKM